MPSYYPSQGSHRSHHGQPVYTTTTRSHQSHRHHGDYGVPATSSSAHYGQPSSHHGGVNVVYVPAQGSRRSHRSHGHNHHHQTQTPQVITVPSSSGHHHGTTSHHDHGHGHGHHHHHRLTFGQRLRRFFGFAPKSDHHHHTRNSSWGFLGYSRRRHYKDRSGSSGSEVDRYGRKIYRV